MRKATWLLVNQGTGKQKIWKVDEEEAYCPVRPRRDSTVELRRVGVGGVNTIRN